MEKIAALLCVAAAALAGCASTDSALPPSAAAAPARTYGDVQVAQVVKVEDYDNRLRCHRVETLGTRIGHRECYTAGAAQDSDSSLDYLRRQEFDRLREQQTYLQQAHETAVQNALRQGAGAPPR